MKIVQIPRGTSAQEDGITGAEGQLRADMERGEIRLHDGARQGGFRIPNVDTVISLIATRGGDTASDASVRIFATEAAMRAYVPDTQILAIVRESNTEDIYIWKNLAPVDFSGDLASDYSGGWYKLTSDAAVAARLAAAGLITAQIGGAEPVVDQDTTAWVDSLDNLKLWNGLAYVTASPALFGRMIGRSATYFRNEGAQFTNADDMTVSGTYWNNNSATNIPSASAGQLLVMATTNPASALTQLWMTTDGATTLAMWIRKRGASVWTAWVPVIISGSAPYVHYNYLINGRMEINQRGTTGAVADGAYLADRWQLVRQSGWATCTFVWGNHSLSSLPDKNLAISFTGTGSAGGSGIRQKIENVRTLQGKQVTVTFSISSNVTQDVEVHAIQRFGTGGSPSAAVDTLLGTISATSSFSEKYVVGTIPQIAGKTVGTNDDDCLEIRIVGTTTAAHTFTITKVVLAEGNTATIPAGDTDFKRPEQVELAMCQRYYERVQGSAAAITSQGAGQMSTTTNAQCVWPFKVQKRIVPTCTIETTANMYSVLTGGATTLAVAVSTSLPSLYAVFFSVTLAAVSTVGFGALWRFVASATPYIDADAEIPG